MAVNLIQTKAGESLCSVALRHGLEDCDRLVPDNAPLVPVTGETLPEGTPVFVPQPKNKLEELLLEALNSFELTQRFPKIEFIRDENRGVADEQPIRELAITNYVIDRGGDGTQPGDFPSHTQFGHDPIGSADPDHFKVQVLDHGVPEGVDEVEISLFALKPHYEERSIGVQPVLVPDEKLNSFTRPTNPRRSLLNVTCKRVPGTAFFRSPYLRLATFESERARRPEQTLLVTDYVDDVFLPDRERFHTEILHQRVEAHYKIRTCPHGLCGVSAFARLAADKVFEIAFHVVGDLSKPADERLVQQIREVTHTWTRRIFAPASLRVDIRRLSVITLPQNVLFVGDSTPDWRGARTTGNDNSGRRSHVEFLVDDRHLVRVDLGPNETPSQTGDRIILAIRMHRSLVGYAAKKIMVPLVNGTAPNASDPCDIVVHRPSGRPAKVTRAQSTDDLFPIPTAITTGLEVESIDDPGWWDDGAGNFVFASNIFHASKQERALRWNHFDDKALNVYVVPFKKLINEDDPADNPVGKARFASLGAVKSTVGPAVYLGHNGVTSDRTTIAHESVHVLMHCFHAGLPPKDVPSTTVPATSSELMQADADTTDAHDTARHLSDHRIRSVYAVVKEDGTPDVRLMDGSSPLVVTPGSGASVPDTPVNRLLGFAARIGLLRNRAWVRVDPAPAQESSEAEAA